MSTLVPVNLASVWVNIISTHASLRLADFGPGADNPTRVPLRRSSLPSGRAALRCRPLERAASPVKSTGERHKRHGPESAQRLVIDELQVFKLVGRDFIVPARVLASVSH